ncbi:MAG TPA: type II TA system antitoxin MqsA family protein [Longimicrobium sp.]|nr:type II TA system antitoxin MqsA family protein [Longimicrobium sp.]
MVPDRCYLCRSEGEIVEEPREVSAGNGRKVTITDRFYRCPNCGETWYSGGMADESFRRGAAALRVEDGLLGPTEIRAIRASYGLSQAGLEKLIGSGEKTVVRWERGTVAQNATADTLLRVLRDHPQVVARLAEERGVRVKMPNVALEAESAPDGSDSPAEESMRPAA